ncbi:EXLDI protein [Nocardia uniformis]|uniref:EXLDI protein n=1 Tax=Nocardia uniformis TaxID=53432 RepID=A0A849C270_9NOCA|nr:EXLDI protein [Nocardia uniformis]NNH71808.1 EXLDI protein [Nocardia uniformis]
MPTDLHKPTDPTSASAEAVTIDVTPGDDSRLTEIELRVGPGGARRQRFVGRLIGEYRQFTTQGVAQLRVYQGRTGKFLIHRQEIDWSDSSQLVANWTKGLRGWRDLIGLGEDGWGEFTTEIVDSIGELRGRLPEKLYRTVLDVIEHPSTQVLDI